MVPMPEAIPRMHPQVVVKPQRPDITGTSTVIVTISAMEKRLVMVTARPPIGIPMSSVTQSLEAIPAKITAGMFTAHVNMTPMIKALAYGICHLLIMTRDKTEEMPIWKESTLEVAMQTAKMNISILMPPVVFGNVLTLKSMNAGTAIV